MDSIRSIFFSKSWFTNNNYKVLTIIAILVMLPLIFGLVYVTGGIKYVYSHTMYIPILLAGIFINPGFGIITAIIAGILLGPIMPYDVLVGDQQAFVNWFYRLFIFLLLGSISGFASQSLRKTNLKIKHLLTHHIETNLPNINALTYFKDQLPHQRYMISTIMIHNADQIIDVLGIDIYNLLLTRVYEHMQTTFKGAVIVQSDHHSLDRNIVVMCS